MEEIDYAIVRQFFIDNYDLKNIDYPYKFYYDETNNCRTLLLKKDGFNIENINKDFVVGGIVLKKLVSNIEIEEFIKEFHFQPTMKEFKLEHFCLSGNFFDCMKSKKIHKLLVWLDQKNIFIHFHALNLLYYSIVDIIDAFSDGKFEYAISNQLKTLLYKYAILDIENFSKLLFKYNFPNIRKNLFRKFSTELVNWIDSIEVEPADKNFIITVKKIIIESKKNYGMILLLNNIDNVLIEDFAQLYIQKLVLFLNSVHTFDEEPKIKEKLRNQKIMVNKNEIKNYVFVNSINERLIQLSDVICGILGRLFTTANQMTIQEITLYDLTELQKNNIYIFKNIIDKSTEENKVFAGYSANLIQIKKIKHILEKC